MRTIGVFLCLVLFVFLNILRVNKNSSAISRLGAPPASTYHDSSIQYEYADYRYDIDAFLSGAQRTRIGLQTARVAAEHVIVAHV